MRNEASERHLLSLAFEEGAAETCPTKCSLEYLPENGNVTSTLREMKPDHPAALTLKCSLRTSKPSQSNAERHK